MNNSGDGGSRSRDEEKGQYAPESSIREIIDILEEKGSENVPTTDIRKELDYSPAGTIKRLRQHPDFFEENDLGEGNPILWSLRYDRRDFLGALDELDDLTPTEDIAEHVGCSEEVAREWLFKLEDEEEVTPKPRGEKYSPLWVKKT
jgi:hypothetical protein